MILSAYLLLLGVLAILSYGFVDPNLTLSTNSFFQQIYLPLAKIIVTERIVTTIVFTVLIILLYVLYLLVLRQKITNKIFLVSPWKFFVILSFILWLAYPALSYDIFNYILTAKITYHYHENPYVVMPIEISNESMLHFTRAANKVALYGPAWIAVTSIPYMLSNNLVWLSILSFKLLNVVLYLATLQLIYRLTRSLRQVIFFGLNPLIIVEVLVSSHNDIFMMILALFGLSALSSNRFRNQLTGVFSLGLSVLVKGATIILLPLILFRKTEIQRIFQLAYWLMLVIFLLTPLREELYPWYGVWFLTFGAVIPLTKQQFLHGFSIALSLGLLLRYLPYLYTREYGGLGPIWRIVLTLVPVVSYGIWYIWKKRFTNRPQ